MPRIIEIGKKGPYAGKRLFEILCNLRGLGAGRLVQRISELEKQKPDSGPNFYRILKAAPQMDDALSHGQCWAEQVRNGRRIPFIVQLKTHLEDYRLVLKAEEVQLTGGKQLEQFPVLGELPEDDLHLNKNYQVPPVMAEFLHQQQRKQPQSLYRHGLCRNQDGYDETSVINYKIPMIYELDEYQQAVRKIYHDN